MGFLRSTTKDGKERKVYMMLFDIDDSIYYKIGVTEHGDPIDRLLQIARSFYMKFRYIPSCTVKRFRSTTIAYKAESKLHKLLKEYKLELDPDDTFDGCTEFFTDIPQDKIIKLYEEVLDKAKLYDKYIKEIAEYDRLPDWAFTDKEMVTVTKEDKAIYNKSKKVKELAAYFNIKKV